MDSSEVVGGFAWILKNWSFPAPWLWEQFMWQENAGLKIPYTCSNCSITLFLITFLAFAGGGETECQNITFAV